MGRVLLRGGARRGAASQPIALSGLTLAPVPAQLHIPPHVRFRHHSRLQRGRAPGGVPGPSGRVRLTAAGVHCRRRWLDGRVGRGGPAVRREGAFHRRARRSRARPQSRSPRGPGRDPLLPRFRCVRPSPTRWSACAQDFQEDPALDALIGSYDASPASQDFLSQYKNLMHCFVHQHGQAGRLHVLERLRGHPPRRLPRSMPASTNRTSVRPSKTSNWATGCARPAGR